MFRLLARPLRLEFPGALYHITARGNAHQPIFLGDGDRHQFIRLLGREVQQQHWRCSVYCLMGNHDHLVIETPEPNLRRGLRRLHGTYTQGLCRYVVLNPVRAGMVAEAGGWAWRSDPATAGIQAAPGWPDVAAALSLFDRTMATARIASRRFVAEGIHQPSPWKDLRGQIVLGGSEFRERVDRLVQGKPLTNVPALQTHPTRLSPDEVLQRVAASYRLPVDAILTRSHRDAYQPAVYLLRCAANELLQTVARRFRISPSRISNIQKAIETTPRSPQHTQLFATCHVKS